ncbi:MAG: hypothetical protein A2787_03915 [Omnitrophica WOR_2 bacterium RIFCSPHIGHO2_01_FULL_48_9]|nr:MAG: hypothetical protein A3D10_06620 [Omnitrophica WOR_2 bacterium RIFCSPHIGHO2_02_FULL_48_11]OGX33529.1 MAG: hypothetical protein A2787_03915 [Omnitrophica WOR_2 bacterium RIFCSPHIGHO2_01_FULL_48_9]
MPRKYNQKQCLGILREAVNTIVRYPCILFPFITVSFIQLLVMELFYFANRYPLVKFFGPVIENRWGEAYLHYPFNLIIVPKLFQYVQIPLYLFVGSFMVALAIYMIYQINENHVVRLKTSIRELKSRYVYIVVAALSSLAVMYVLYSLYGTLMMRAWHIKSKSGIFYSLKTFVLYGEPYVNLLIGVMATTVFAFLLPILVVEKKKFFVAFALNFKTLFHSWWSTFLIVLIPTLFYIPILLFKTNVAFVVNTSSPELWLWAVILSIPMMALIDSVIYTALTLKYLILREN